MPVSDQHTKRLNAIILMGFDLTRGSSGIPLAGITDEANDEEVINQISERLPEIHSSRRREALEKMHIWLTKRIADAVELECEPTLGWKDFKRLCDAVTESAVKHCLMNYAHAIDASPERLDAEIGQNQLYVKQMDWIGLEERQQFLGAHDYLVAAANREGWLKDDSLFDEDIETFENRLLTGFRSQERNVQLITANESDPQKKGQALYDACMTPAYCSSFTIGNQSPLEGTVAGSFHALANGGDIGWIPDWRTRCQRLEADNG